MNKFKLTLPVTLLFIIHLSAQSPKLSAPPDIVISGDFTFDWNRMTDPAYNVFGIIQTDKSQIKKVFTKDVVCYNYCNTNPCTKYSGSPSSGPIPKLAPNQACDYYNKYFDTAHSTRSYNLEWGVDGLMENVINSTLKITVINNLISGQSSSVHGNFLRIYSVESNNNTVLIDTQTVWIVDCRFTPNFTNALSCVNQVQLSLDEKCAITLWPEMFLSGGPYKCYDAYKVQARFWTTTGSGGLIDRNPNLAGVQFDCRDIGRDFRVTIIDSATGNSCWTHVTVEDKYPPQFIYPDTILLPIDSTTCLATWKVIPPIITDCCGANTYNLRIIAGGGKLTGDSATGYQVQNIPAGIYNATLTAIDGSGNRTAKKVIYIANGNFIPNAACKKNQSVNFSSDDLKNKKVYWFKASSLDGGSYTFCNSMIYSKIIIKYNLLGTQNGSSFDNNTGCNFYSNDHDPSINGKQIYFDDSIAICCLNMGEKVPAILRVFGKNPGSGPVHPSRMDSNNGDLYSYFNDCEVVLDVQNNSSDTCQLIISDYNNPIHPQAYIYPNPAINKLFLNTEINYDQIIFTNMLGRKMIKAAGINLNQIEINDLSSGSYILELKQKNQSRLKTKLFIAN